MENLYEKLFAQYSEELNDLGLGHKFSEAALCNMKELLMAIDFLQCGNPSDDELIKILEHYE